MHSLVGPQNMEGGQDYLYISMLKPILRFFGLSRDADQKCNDLTLCQLRSFLYVLVSMYNEYERIEKSVTCAFLRADNKTVGQKIRYFGYVHLCPSMENGRMGSTHHHKIRKAPYLSKVNVVGGVQDEFLLFFRLSAIKNYSKMRKYCPQPKLLHLEIPN